MGVISGQGGWVSGQDTVRRWSVNYQSDNKEFRASNTRGGTGRLAGNTDWNGSYDFYGHTPAFMPAELIAFAGFGPQAATGPAIVDALGIECDIEGGGIISGNVDFSANGALTRDAAEVQTIDLSGGDDPTGGTFTITYDGQTTAAIAYDATAAAVQAALEALSNITAGTVSVFKVGFVYTIVFDAALGDVAEVTVNSGSLTSGGTVTVNVSTLVTGGGTGTASDLSIPDPPSAVGCKVNLSGSDVDDVRRWSLNLTGNNKDYRSSSTAGQTKRVAGSIDGSGSYEVYTDDLATLPDEGTLAILQLYVNATQYWELTWAIIDSVEPEVDVEEETPIGATVNFSFSGFNGGAVGSITKPGAGSAHWPAA